MLAYLKICLIALSFFVALKSASACNTPDYKQAARLDQKKEFSHAFHAFTRLEKGGCPKASYYLGKYYAYGLGTEANDLKALAYYHQFLKNDIKFKPRPYRAHAYQAMTMLYLKQKNTSSAKRYLIKSAKIGNNAAQLALARYYLHGNSLLKIAKDSKKSAYWSKQAQAPGI